MVGSLSLYLTLYGLAYLRARKSIIRFFTLESISTSYEIVGWCALR